MSSNIRVQRICQQCGKEFEARKTTTKTCSDNCAKKLYKQNKRAANIENSDKQTLAIKLKPVEMIKAKEFLTVPDVAMLLTCSRRTAYRLIKQGSIKGVNLAQRKTLVKRSDIDKLFA
ncbi:MAG TPA: helix-turn-helix domain-containing protein [Chitinophagaceae bacterium]|nr:helix-turn-helix domain-containing protein [Chitinophagaceae bacterium]